MASGEELGGWRGGGGFSPIEVLAEAIVPFLSPPPTEPQSLQVETISVTPSTWLTLFALPWCLFEALPHPTYGPVPSPVPLAK